MKRKLTWAPWALGAAAATVVVGGGLMMIVPSGVTSANVAALAPVTTAPSSRTAAGTDGSSTAAAVTPGQPSAPTGPGTTAPAAAPNRPATAAVTRPAITAPAPAPAVRPAPAAPSGPAPAAPGTYRYHQVASLAGTPAEGTLVVAPASASGSQIWTRVVGGPIPPSSLTMLFNANGAFLQAPGASVAGTAATCSFSAPVAWPPWPTVAGRSASGHANCTGSIASYDVTARVQGPATLSLDGKPIDTMVVINTIVITGSANGSPLHVTLVETDSYASSLRVPVQTITHMAATVIGMSVTTDRTDTLESSTPS